MRERDFQFSDIEWEMITRDLRNDSEFNAEDCRWALSLHCGSFAELRPANRLGKDLPTPDRARDAWLDIASAAKRLKVAIEGLRKAGASDFGFIGSGADRWAADLPALIHSAEWAANMEPVMRPPVAHNADPHRDGFVEVLVRIWLSHRSGDKKKVSTAEKGPLMRFLVAVATPTFAAVNEDPPSEATLRGILRKLLASSAEQ